VSQGNTQEETQGDSRQVPVENLAVVPTVTVSLLKSVQVLPGQSTIATVKMDKTTQVENLWLLEYSSVEMENRVGVQVEDSLLDARGKEQAEVRLTNLSGLTQKLTAGTVLGTV